MPLPIMSDAEFAELLKDASDDTLSYLLLTSGHQGNLRLIRAELSRRCLGNASDPVG